MPLSKHNLPILEVEQLRLIRDHAAKARNELKRLVDRLPPEYRSYGVSVTEVKPPIEILHYLTELTTVLDECWQRRSGRETKSKILPTDHRPPKTQIKKEQEQPTFFDRRFNPEQVLPKTTTKTQLSGLIRVEDTE